MSDAVEEIVETPHGPARVHIQRVGKAEGLLVLGHGAGGGVETPDLGAAVRAANAVGFTAVLVEQPYRVAGRRSQAPAGQLDSAWITVVRQVRESERHDQRVLVGGRSAGARVACRTATELGADGVVCLAFPVHPPGRANDPSKSRLPELDAVRVPVLVVQGDSDPFGKPPPRRGRKVVLVPGTHSLRNAGEVGRAIEDWLRRLLARAARG